MHNCEIFRNSTGHQEEVVGSVAWPTLITAPLLLLVASVVVRSFVGCCCRLVGWLNSSAGTHTTTDHQDANELVHSASWLIQVDACSRCFINLNCSPSVLSCNCDSNHTTAPTRSRQSFVCLSLFCLCFRRLLLFHNWLVGVSTRPCSSRRSRRLRPCGDDCCCCCCCYCCYEPR